MRKAPLRGTTWVGSGFVCWAGAVRGARLEDAFKRVRLNVRLASEGRQIPWESTSLEEDLYLFPDQRKKLSEAAQDKLFDEEISSWMRVKTSNDYSQLAKFIREYPSGSASPFSRGYSEHQRNYRVGEVLTFQRDRRAHKSEQAAAHARHIGEYR